jgi:hypothetical protein
MPRTLTLKGGEGGRGGSGDLGRHRRGRGGFLRAPWLTGGGPTTATNALGRAESLDVKQQEFILNELRGQPIWYKHQTDIPGII